MTNNQTGWFTKEPRRKGTVWIYHYYCTRESDGRRVEHTKTLGYLADLPTEADARAALKKVDLAKANFTQGIIKFDSLVTSYKKNDVPELAASTQSCYKHVLDDYLTPRWGKLAATKIEPLEIEGWLKSLKQLSNPSKDKIRRVMFLVFKHGQRYGLIPRSEDSNPVRWVRQSARSNYEAVSVTPEQAYKIMMELPPMERMLTLLIAATGLRISEALGLQWADIDYDRKQIHVRRAWVDNTIGEPKTRASKAPVPLSRQLGEYLLEWQRQTLYSREQDWVFPSLKMKGTIPRSASIMVADYLRPAAIKAGVELSEGQRFGFHNLRHALATFLVSKGTDPKTVQQLLRHANITTTLELYAHGTTEDRLRAQESVMDAMVN